MGAAAWIILALGKRKEVKWRRGIRTISRRIYVDSILSREALGLPHAIIDLDVATIVNKPFEPTAMGWPVMPWSIMSAEMVGLVATALTLRMDAASDGTCGTVSVLIGPPMARVRLEPLVMRVDRVGQVGKVATLPRKRIV